jgi:4-hydroxybenzoyl-CoA thioesterase/acyl-CoA thioester hydrolase
MSDPAANNEFKIKRRVHFSETDRAGVLYFAHYYRFMEETEHAFRRSLGLDIFAEIDGYETTWPRVATSCEYFAPARFDDLMDVALKIVAMGARSITYEIEFRLDGRRLALGRMTAVYCMLKGGEFKPATIPDSLRRALTGGVPAR